jgi:hypothetical protein
VAAVAKKAENISVVSAAKAKTLPSKIIGAAIITDVSPAKKFYEDVTVVKHTNLVSIAKTRNRRGRPI